MIKVNSLSVLHPGFKSTRGYDAEDKNNYSRTYKKNTVKTAVLGAGVLGGAIGASIIANAKPESRIGKLKGSIKNPFANLIKPESKVAAFLGKAVDLVKKPFTAVADAVKNVKLFNTGMNKVRDGKEFVAGFVNSMPKSVKLGAAALAGLVVLNHIYRAGRTDQRFDDKAAVKHVK